MNPNDNEFDFDLCYHQIKQVIEGEYSLEQKKINLPQEDIPLIEYCITLSKQTNVDAAVHFQNYQPGQAWKVAAYYKYKHSKSKLLMDVFNKLISCDPLDRPEILHDDDFGAISVPELLQQIKKLPKANLKNMDIDNSVKIVNSVSSIKSLINELFNKELQGLEYYYVNKINNAQTVEAVEFDINTAEDVKKFKDHCAFFRRESLLSSTIIDCHLKNLEEFTEKINELLIKKQKELEEIESQVIT